MLPITSNRCNFVFPQHKELIFTHLMFAQYQYWTTCFPELKNTTNQLQCNANYIPENYQKVNAKTETTLDSIGVPNKPTMASPISLLCWLFVNLQQHGNNPIILEGLATTYRLSKSKQHLQTTSSETVLLHLTKVSISANPPIKTFHSFKPAAVKLLQIRRNPQYSWTCGQVSCISTHLQCVIKICF